ncbi:hypothetical protein UFOVP80_14 [uncultured Caudovirales phage]|uniref:Uncharacterized protein n=1 Tax=uncultured Caudovirales phage TaxID=2100421 RepID=A0A6J5KZ09_9CAUD|nr:hypothetical protein UFOVP80_14 [uncultured Caudovirales phage]
MAWKFVDEEEPTVKQNNGWRFVNEPEAGPADLYRVPEKTPEELKNMSVQERLDFAKDLTRQREYQTGKGFTKGLISGATLGLSEQEPGTRKAALGGPLGFVTPALKPTEEEHGVEAGKLVGSVLPINQLMKIFGPLGTLASKSPILQKPLAALARLTGVAGTGATYEGLQKGIKGEVPSADDLIEHGAQWAALDVALNSLGWAGRFTSNLLKKARGLKEPPHEVLNETINKLKDQGVDFTQPERVAAKALAILETAPREGAPPKPIKLPEKPKPSPIETIARENLTPVEALTKDLTDKKVSPTQFDKLAENEITFTEEKPSTPISFEDASNALDKGEIDLRMNQVFPERIREQELGQNIQMDLESTLQETKDITKPLYDEAYAAAETIHITPTTVTTIASDILQNLERLKTRPAGYNSVINTIENVFEDLGYIIERNEKGKFSSAHAAKESANGGDLIEIGKRLNEITDYDVLDATIKDRLKPITKAVKQDIRNALSSNEDALNAFEAAESLHGATAEKFNKDAIRRIRSSEAPEKFISDISSPSTLEALKDILQPKQMEAIERQLLEEMKEVNYLQARKLYSELKPHLSYEADLLGDQIVKSKIPTGTPAKTKAVQENILNDLSNSMVTGERPTKTLNLWQTPQGRELIKEALKGNKNKDEVIKFLKNQSFFDYASEFVNKDGKIDFKKFNNLMKDKEFVRNIKDIGGEEAVTFFRQMQGRVDNFDKLLSILDKLPPKLDSPRGKYLIQKSKEKALKTPKITGLAKDVLKPGQKIPKAEWGKERLKQMAAKDFPLQTKLKAFLDYLGISGKVALTTFGILKLGLPSASMTAISLKLLYNLATRPSTRKAFQKSMQKPKDLTQLINAWIHFEDLLDKDHEPE